VTLYVDKGLKGRLESDSMDPARSPDRPVFVNGRPVAATVAISQPGAPMGAGAALLDVFNQPAATTVSVAHVIVPEKSWIIVYAEENGAPGRVMGQVSIPATDAIGVTVSLMDPPAARSVFVALHIDEGVADTFEYARGVGGASKGPDRPYIVGGTEAIKRIDLQ